MGQFVCAFSVRVAREIGEAATFEDSICPDPPVPLGPGPAGGKENLVSSVRDASLLSGHLHAAHEC